MGDHGAIVVDGGVEKGKSKPKAIPFEELTAAFLKTRRW
jgi:hypothetical protein